MAHAPDYNHGPEQASRDNHDASAQDNLRMAGILVPVCIPQQVDRRDLHAD